MLAWFETLPNLEAAWASCADPAWIVTLARLGGIDVRQILRAIAVSFPPWSADPSWGPAAARIDAILRETVSGYVSDGPTDATVRDLEGTVLPQVRDWNIGRAPAALWPLVRLANAVLRLHAQAADHERWPWPGRLSLVIGWLVDQTCMDRDWVFPLGPGEVSTMSEREPEARAALAAKLRSLLSIPTTDHQRDA
jgi:hypothetical protein